MSIVKVGKSRQVVIPKDIWDTLQLEPGDYFEVEEEHGRIVFVPKKLVDRDQIIYLSKECQKGIQEALKEVKEGKTKRFDNVEDLIQDLKS